MHQALRYTQKLEDSGWTRQQAETHLEVLSECIEDKMVTKQDLALAKEELRYEFKTDFFQLRREFEKLRAEVTHLEARLTIKLGAITTVAIGAVVVILKLVG